MRYVEFRDVLRTHLARHPEGATWEGLPQTLALPYARPCPTWVRRVEREVGLVRTRGAGRALVWRLVAPPAPRGTTR